MLLYTRRRKAQAKAGKSVGLLGNPYLVRAIDRTSKYGSTAGGGIRICD
jgi:hypothetical protein